MAQIRARMVDSQQHVVLLDVFVVDICWSIRDLNEGGSRRMFQAERIHSKSQLGRIAPFEAIHARNHRKPSLAFEASHQALNHA